MLLAAALLLGGQASDLPSAAPMKEIGIVSIEIDPAPLRWRITAEAGGLWTTRNDVRIPGDSGTRFSLTDLTDEGAWPVARLTIEHDLDERHGLRLLYAPVRTDGTGVLAGPTDFAGQTFAAGSARGEYRFDTWRLGYRYTFHDSEAWQWKVGGTLLVRDAAIELRQGALRARDTDLGLVPLLNLTGEWRFAERWAAVLDLEGAAAPQGRAVDLALTAGYDLDERTRLSFGYRTIEGGADNDSVFTFAWIHQVVVSVRWSF